MFYRSKSFLNKWRLLVCYMFRVMFIFLFHELITFYFYWFIIKLRSNINLHIFVFPLHNLDLLMSASCLFQWWIGRFWTQLVLRCWWLNSYLQSVWLTNQSWRYVGWTHWSTFINRLFLGHNFKRGFSKLLFNNLLLFSLLNWLQSWRVNKFFFF
jgi:hypothetical protein